MSLTPPEYYAHGKLLLTGEYFVLDGAQALAVPSRRGQGLRALGPVAKHELHWRSLMHTGECWFEASWQLTPEGLRPTRASDTSVADRFTQLLLAIQAQDVRALSALFGQAWESQLEFPRNWGLGSSSTLISLLAQVTQTNPYALLAASFGGSGYDLACARAKGAILFQRKGEQPQVQTLDWQAAYRDQVYFIHLGRKQNSREGIRIYRELGGPQPTLIDAVSELTRAFLAAEDYQTAARIILAHEELVSQTLSLPKVQDRYFADFPGVVKSLGAWGGDFVMALSELSASETRDYFKTRKFAVVVPWEEMVHQG